jgi:membrane protein implicated in regulation of membrane protease activity
MFSYKKYTKKQLTFMFIGLVFLFFFDDVLIVILIKQFGYLRKNWWLTSIILLWLFLVSVGLAYAVLKVKREKPTTGGEGLLGEFGTVIRIGNYRCQVSVHGEIWSADCETRLEVGDRIRVRAIDGLVLLVDKIPHHEFKK